MKANNVTRLLEARGIRYTAYELPPEKLSALETARLLGVPADQMFKTIVVTGEGRRKPVLAVVPAGCEVNLKGLALAVGEKKLHIPTQRQAEQLTGLKAGGISPLALLNRGFKTYLDSSAQAYEEMHISGGQRGLNLRLPTRDFIALTNANIADIGA